jgi:predicted RNase H-like HicB family nuclease
MDTERKKTVTDYLKLPYHRSIVPAEEGGFFAEILEFPGCIAEGDTVVEAYQNLEEVAAAWIEGTLEDGQKIPEPAIDHSYSGKFALRLPRDLHRMAAVKAAREGVSLNSCFVAAISAWVGADNLFERIAHKVEMKFVQANFYKITVTGEQVFSTASPFGWNVGSSAVVVAGNAAAAYVPFPSGSITGTIIGGSGSPKSGSPHDLWHGVYKWQT